MKIQFNHILNYLLVMTFFSDCTASSKCLNVVVKNYLIYAIYAAFTQFLRFFKT